MKTLRFAAMLALVASTTFACSGDDDDSPKDGSAGSAGTSANGSAGADDGSAGADGAPSTSAPFELVGEYEDNFGGEQIITETDWNGSAIVGYDNDKNVVYTQFPEDDMYSPSKFAKTVYTEPNDGSFYFCMVEFSLDTLAEAEASEASADDSDPETKGCGDFSWTKATAK